MITINAPVKGLPFVNLRFKQVKRSNILDPDELNTQSYFQMQCNLLAYSILIFCANVHWDVKIEIGSSWTGTVECKCTKMMQVLNLEPVRVSQNVEKWYSNSRIRYGNCENDCTDTLQYHCINSLMSIVITCMDLLSFYVWICSLTNQWTVVCRAETKNLYLIPVLTEIKILLSVIRIKCSACGFAL